MRLLLGMSNLSKPGRPRNARAESARLTQSLARRQKAIDDGETVNVTRALRSSQSKLRRSTDKPRSTPRRDSLAEAKVVAAQRQWKPEPN